MIGGMSPETCWASYKYEIKFWYNVASCWTFFVNSYQEASVSILCQVIWYYGRIFRDFSPQVYALTAPRSGHDRFLSNPWHFTIHASSSFSKPYSHFHITGNCDTYVTYGRLPLLGNGTILQAFSTCPNSNGDRKCHTSQIYHQCLLPHHVETRCCVPTTWSAWQANKWRVQKIGTIHYAAWPSTRIVGPRSQCPGTPLENVQHYKY